MKYILIFIILTIFYGCNSPSGDQKTKTSENKKIKQIIQTYDNGNERFIKKYDKNGNLIHLEWDFDEKYGGSDKIYKNYYDNNLLIKQEYYYRNEKDTRLSMIYYYTYNPDSTINTEIYKDSDGRVYWESKYNYKTVNNKRELTIYKYDDKGKLLQELFYKYDSIGRVIQEPWEYDGTILGTIKYDYFGKDSVHETIIDNDIENPDSFYSYRIDKNGDYLENDDSDTKYKWKYDEFGNWIEKKIVEGNRISTVYREIIYY